MSWSSCVSSHIIHVISPQNPPKITAVCFYVILLLLLIKNTIRSLCELELEDKSAGGILKNNIHTIILLAFIDVKTW